MEVIMTRQELLALGYTEEQINQIMALHGQATQQLRATIDTNNSTIATLQAQVHQAQAQASNNTPEPTPEPEPQNPELAQALARVAELEKLNRQSEIKAYASSKNLTGEQADNILNAFGDNVESAKSAIDSISQIISDTDKNARDAEKQALLDNTPNPGGSQGQNNTKSSAENIASKFFSTEKQSNDVLSHYLNGGN